jgi:hypothetical protein
MISPYVYWKSSSAELNVPAPMARRLLCHAMAELGFAVSADHGGHSLTFTCPASLPGLPHLQVWTARIDGEGRRTKIGIEFGLGATPGSWLSFAAATVLAVAPILVPGFEMAALLPLFWLLACVVWMQWRPGRQEAQMWRSISSGATIGGRSSSWRAVE